jgi:polysaccharide export outer membrane protein
MAGQPQGNYYPQPERMMSVDPDAKLAPGDAITVEIEQDREGGFAKRVSVTGEIDVPPYGRVKVAGRTTSEAASEIKRLLEKDYYYVATIRLSLDGRSIAANKTGTVTLAGELRMVGPQDLEDGNKLTVSQAVMKAGGFSAFANRSKVQVTRTEGGQTKQFVVDVQRVIEKGAVDQDPVLVDGDRIFVPRRIFNY